MARYDMEYNSDRITSRAREPVSFGVVYSIVIALLHVHVVVVFQ